MWECENVGMRECKNAGMQFRYSPIYASKNPIFAAYFFRTKMRCDAFDIQAGRDGAHVAISKVDPLCRQS